MFKKHWILYAIIFALFLEGKIFSFSLFGARVRIVQILEIIACLYLLSQILKGQRILKRTPLDIALWSYVGINFLSLINAVWFERSLKISLLLLSLAGLYYITYLLLESKELFQKAFKLFLYVGVFEILFGFYQIAAGVFNCYFGNHWPIGELGMVHVQYIASPWGRPYGTLIEPDWYGAVCMFYAVLLSVLSAKPSKEKNHLFYFLLLVLSSIGLFLSFVRAAWVGFIFASGLLVALKFKNKSMDIDLGKYFRNLIFVTLIISFTIFLSPQIRGILKERFHPTYDQMASLNIKNGRVEMMRKTIFVASKNMLVGNAPGSSGIIYMIQAKGEDHAKKVLSKKIILQNSDVDFDPSIITTVLGDTGIIGMVIFLFFIASIVFVNLKTIPLLNSEYQLVGVGFFLGLIGLFISYFFTQGLWMPFSWIFLALNMAALRFGLEN